MAKRRSKAEVPAGASPVSEATISPLELKAKSPRNGMLAAALFKAAGITAEPALVKLRDLLSTVELSL